MRYNITIIFMIFLGITMTVGCNGVENTDIKNEDVLEDGILHESTVSNDRDIIISGAEAREIFFSNDQVILLDVRNQDEFDEHHIPDSILIPVNELESRLSELPDKDVIIIVFCRAGRRSELAASILTANGYTNVYNMQGIGNWEN